MIHRSTIPVLLVLNAGCGNAPAGPPSFAEVQAAYRPSDHRLLDRHGRILYERRVDLTERRLAWTPLAAISPALVDAVVLAEDRRFREHGGVDLVALVRAALASVSGRRHGASTLTMQLTGLVDPYVRQAPPGSWRRKFRQIRRAWAFERVWTKEEILEAYLNLVPVRGELRGIHAAARRLFGVAPGSLSRAQSVAIAASLPAPNAAAEELLRRARRLVARAGDSGEGLPLVITRITQQSHVAAPAPAWAPHLAVRLLSPSGPAERVTTLDGGAQRFAMESVEHHLQGLAARGVRDAAVLVADNAGGDVLAYVGSSGALSAAPHVDGVRALRQAGSTLKPFLYATAVDRRFLTAASILEDSPLKLFLEVGAYRPTNYDDRFHGALSLRAALATSRNVPAVRTLGLVGGETFLERLHQLGLTSLHRPADHYGPGLALGSGEVTLWDLVNAYRVLANGGSRTGLRLTPQDSADDATASPVFSPEAAFIVADILADREARSAAFGLDGALATPFWSAVKTGTSTDMRDNWCIGFSRRYTVGVWVGNFSGAPMGDVSGVTGAAPIWADVMRWLHRGEPSPPPRQPADVVARDVVDSSGGRRSEWFLRGTEPPRERIPAAVRAPRIVAPVDGALLALDPGIPAASQRVPLQSTPTRSDSSWWLDGQWMGPADRVVLWEPRQGTHALELRDASGRVVDRVAFRVR